MFCSSDTRIFVCIVFLMIDTIRLMLFITGQYFFNKIFHSLWIVSDLNSNPNNLIEISSIRVFSQLDRRLFDVGKYFSDSFKNILFVRINSNKLKTKLLFYCFLPFHFIVNVFVTMTILISFYCKLIAMKI